MFYLILSLLLIYSPAYAQQHSEIEGVWNGIIDVYGDELKIQITFTYTDRELDGTLDIPRQQAFNLPVEVTYAEGETVIFQFETGTGPAIFYGKWDDSGKTIVGEFEQIGERFPFHLKQQARSGQYSTDQPQLELQIPTREAELGGTLVLQENPSPLIILLTGSGSQDRNETVAGFGVFHVLSKELYQQGFSTFRYDDRGVGSSTGNPDATLEELAQDLVDVVDHLKMEYSDRFTDIVFLGHSQGGLVASIAAMETEPKSLIFMAAPFITGDKIINRQIEMISETQGISREILNLNLEFQEKIYEVVRTGGSWEPIEESLRVRLQAQINQLPEQQREALGDMSSFIQSQVRRQLAGAQTRWFKSLIEFEPAETIQKIEVPILALFGEKDRQVFPDSNLEEAKRIERESAVKLDYVIIPEANHLFQKANSGMPSEYGLLEKSFADEFIATIVEWLRGIEENPN